MANESYNNSWWGDPVLHGFGNIYYNLELRSQFNLRVIEDQGTIENLECIKI